MSKKQLYYEKARERYVQDMMGYDEIIKLYPVARSTLVNWGRQGKWEEARKREIAATESLKDTSKEIAEKMGAKILEVLDQGNMPDTRVLQAYARIVSSLGKTVEFEQLDNPPEEAKGEVGDKAKHAIEQLFGKQL